ncbi:replication initiator protein A [Staphylococcus pseudoxylosus]|uniref:replication initiator protein A n=1 Tax=Staphylococcus pseudoxylosus TaxID=2282419 RepID=UPI002DB7B05E|nr:replication initiator protein A [Staphylococcus pseudoxylosus]MEB6038026.1 replication initiator protein A [Staphylococcus pseudoxylosus]
MAQKNINTENKNSKFIDYDTFINNSFIKLFKFLFEDSHYNDLSLDGKLMYCLLRDRLELSKANRWIDENGSLFFKYSIQELIDILNYSKPKIIKLKKELSEYSLVREERVGLKSANHLYLQKPPHLITNSTDFKVEDEKIERFYKLPKFLFEDSYYKKISSRSKVMYAMLKERFESSCRNDTDSFIDESGNPYCVYTNKQLVIILGFSEKPIINCKNELIAYGLMIQRRVGLNKANKIYLLEPKHHYSSEVKNLQFQKSKIYSSGGKKSTVLEVKKFQSNETYNKETYNKETYVNDKKNDNSINHSNLSEENKILREMEIDTITQNLPKNVQIILKRNYPFSIKDIKILKDTIFDALDDIEKYAKQEFYINYFEVDISNVLKRLIIYKVKDGIETIPHLKKYFHKSVLNEMKLHISDNE